MFEVAANSKLRDQLFRENKLVKLEGAAASEAKRLCVPECPSWFAPKPIAAYEVWGYADEPGGNFRILIDRSTGTLFFTDFQV